MPKFRAILCYLAIGFAINIAITWIGSQYAPIKYLTDTPFDSRTVSILTTARSFADISELPEKLSQEDLEWAREVERMRFTMASVGPSATEAPYVHLSAFVFELRSAMVSFRNFMYETHGVRSDIYVDSRFCTQYDVGFPFRALSAQQTSNANLWDGDLRAALPLDWLPGRALRLFPSGAPDWDKRPIPFLPLWPGLIANTAIYALIPAMIPPLIRWWRVRRKLCGHCGYARDGLPQAAPCPECGTVPRFARKQGASVSAQTSVR